MWPHYLIAFGCAMWAVQAGLLFVHLARMRSVARVAVAEPGAWPTVTAVLPARNEAASLSAALTSRFADDYPALDVVLVDDRSTDATGLIASRFAEGEPRLAVVRIDELPDGWLGKVHALDSGFRAARGEWLLISDADIEMARGGLRRAIAYCDQEHLDFLALVPEFRSHSFLVDVVWTVFMRTLGMLVDPAAVRDPRSRVAMGSGGFMLVRRSVFERTPGFEHLRLETTDDIALGMMMKRAGARCDFADGRGIARISIYDDLGAFFCGVEKNAGSLVRAPFVAVVGALLVAAFFEFAPFLALGSSVSWLRWTGGASAAVATWAAVAALRRNTGLVLPAFLWPLGWLLVSAGILRAAWLLHRRGGVVWRDTFYSRKQLLAGQRFRAL